MTRKDYRAIAERLARSADKYQFDEGRNIVAEVVEDLVEVFGEDNPRFDADKFRKACGI
jgi:hypothetical protein